MARLQSEVRLVVVSQSQEIAERLARLVGGEAAREDTVVENDERNDIRALEVPVSTAVSPGGASVGGLLDKLENARQLVARGFDEDSIRAYLKIEQVWNALRFTLYDGASVQVDEVRRRCKTLFPHVPLGNGRTARELVHIVKLVDVDATDLSPAQRQVPFAGTETGFMPFVEDAITVRRELALKRAPIIGRDEDDAEARRISSARTMAEQKIFDFTMEHGLELDDELATLLKLGAWRGYDMVLAEENGRPWIHMWRGRSVSSRIDRGAALFLVQAGGITSLAMARRTDVDAIREGAEEPTSRPDVVAGWLGLDRPL